MKDREAGLSITPLSGALGAEIDGIDLARLDDETFAAVHDAFLRHQVLAFRGQSLSAPQYLAFARRFGAPAVYPFAKGMADHPEITPLIKEPHQTSSFGAMWHADTTYKADPPKATMLMAVEVPTARGDTLFACQYKAFEALSEGMRGLLMRLSAESSSRKNAAALRQTHLEAGAMAAADTAPEALTAIHPCVRRHPETGRPALYVNRAHTTRFEGMTEAESAGLLEFLFTHQIRQEFTARLRWAPGTVVIWDNRSSQHCAINDYDGWRREMWRITLEGETPEAA